MTCSRARGTAPAGVPAGVRRALGMGACWLVVGLAWLGAASVSPAAPAAPAAADEYSSEGANACIDCHESSNVLGIVETKHADFDDPKSPAAQKQCQSCHGPSLRHMHFPLQVANLRFGEGSKVAPAVQNQQCLECHAEDAEQADWKGSAHGFDDVLCNRCHSIHQPDLITPSEAKVAATCTESCHGDLMAGKPPEEFIHAVGMKLEGDAVMTCSTCHNPQGPLDSGRCMDCHESALTPKGMAKQSPRAREFHQTASKQGTDCIRCHKGLAHPISGLSAATP